MSAHTAPADDWRDSAACKDMASAYYDPWHPDGDTKAAYNEARYICKGCPVRAECLVDAMKTEGDAGESSRYGVFGGLSPSQRAELAGATTKHRRYRIEHGTSGGAAAHRRRKELPVCPDCLAAESLYRSERKRAAGAS